MRREDIVNFLRINHVSESAPDEQVREIFIMGKWSSKDADHALLILRGKATESSGMSIATAIVESNTKPSSETVASLLGLDVSLKELESKRAHAHAHPSFSGRALHSLLILAVSTLVAVGMGILLMYFFESGPHYRVLSS